MQVFETPQAKKTDSSRRWGLAVSLGQLSGPQFSPGQRVYGPKGPQSYPAPSLFTRFHTGGLLPVPQGEISPCRGHTDRRGA